LTLTKNSFPGINTGDEISKKIIEGKKRRLLEEWTDQLKKRAKIDINEKLLSRN
jgi:hypothetical protein